MNILSRIADAMQTVLTIIADNISRESGFVKRLRKLSGSKFVQTLVFGWLSNPSATLDELAQTAAALGLHITPQALDKRFTKKAADFLKRMNFLKYGQGVEVALPRILKQQSKCR